MSTIDMMKVMAIVVFIAHWIACAFFAIGTASGLGVCVVSSRGDQ